MKLKIYKMGPKLGIYFPKKCLKFLGLRKGNLIKIVIRKDNKEKIFLTKFNQTISIRKEVFLALNLKSNDVVEAEITKIKNTQRENSVFKNNKIDMLALIAQQTSRGYKIFVNEFEKDNEKGLRVWYSHSRGSGKQFEIKRFVNIDLFGRLLGQIQAEGTKSSERRFRLEFCNKLILEHTDFIRYLEELGISKKLLKCHCTYHPDVRGVQEKIKKFEMATGVPIIYTDKNAKSKGSYGFHTYIRSVLITEIILNALDMLRKRMVEKDWDKNLKKFANAFFAKLLTGDGTLDITTKNREYDFPETRIKITDGNLNYLKDYAIIMEKLDFKPHINEKHIWVRSYVGFEKLLYLYRIKAFYNTNNWKKLIVLINIYLDGRRLNTNWRFVDLLNCDSFNSVELSKKYRCTIWAINDWLNNKEREGYVERVYLGNPVKWRLTFRARELAQDLICCKRDFIRTFEKYNYKSLHGLLSQLKLKI